MTLFLRGHGYCQDKTEVQLSTSLPQPAPACPSLPQFCPSLPQPAPAGPSLAQPAPAWHSLPQPAPACPSLPLPVTACPSLPQPAPDCPSLPQPVSALFQSKCWMRRPWKNLIQSATICHNLPQSDAKSELKSAPICSESGTKMGPWGHPRARERHMEKNRRIRG